ncbi:MAG: hypothetical protein AAFO74_07380 [Pseudomonadota bacterium]
MSTPQTQKRIAIFVTLLSLIVQIGFAIGVFGPAWLSPVLTLPALASIAWLWRQSERQRAETQAFTALVI